MPSTSRPIVDSEEQRKQLQIEVDRLRAERNANAEVGRHGEGEGRRTPRRCSRRARRSAAQLADGGAAARRPCRPSSIACSSSCRTCCRIRCPTARDESANVELRRWGTPREFGFKPHDHVDLGETLGTASISRPAADRRRALRRAARRRRAAAPRARASSCSTCTRASTATPRCTCRTSSTRRRCTGTGQLPKFEQDLFAVRSERGHLPDSRPPKCRSRTSCATRSSTPATLPLKLVAHTPCFRSEAGAYGQGHARHDPPAPVRQGRARADRRAGRFARGARRAHRARRGGAAEARAAVSRRWRCARATSASAARKTYDLEVWLPAQNALPRDLLVQQLRSVSRRGACRRAGATRPPASPSRCTR